MNNDLNNIWTMFPTVTMGKLHLVDLAGSERLVRSVVEGQNKKEAQQINASLTALGTSDFVSGMAIACSRALLRRRRAGGVEQAQQGGRRQRPGALPQQQAHTPAAGLAWRQLQDVLHHQHPDHGTQLPRDTHVAQIRAQGQDDQKQSRMFPPTNQSIPRNSKYLSIYYVSTKLM
jgi:hypothetical protein